MITKKGLLERLKAEGLPHSLNSLLKMEREGIIDRPKETVTYGYGDIRIYSEEEVEDIIFTLHSIYGGKGRRERTI